MNEALKSFRKNLKSGKVYRRQELERWSNAIDRHLAELVKEGDLKKLSQGLYYAPKKTKFGEAPPDENILLKGFLQDDQFMVMSPNMYNNLNLGLTQLYNKTWVYNHKRKGSFTLGNREFEFKLKSSFPNSLSKEYVLVDMLNNLSELAEDTGAIIVQLKKRIADYNFDNLYEMATRYGNSMTKKLIRRLHKNNDLLYA
jgi:hypothetical protein